MDLIRVIVVDDEPLARQKIRRVVETDPQLEVVADCRTGAEAISAIATHRPDLVFMDIQMPDMDAFTILRSLKTESLPVLIFITAYDTYAVRAFDVHAVDYLVKPFESDRLRQAVLRAKKALVEQGKMEDRIFQLIKNFARSEQYLQRILIRREGGISPVKVEDIDWIEAHSKYVYLHVGSNTYLSRVSSTRLEEQLDPGLFTRIHRTAIVNVDKISQMRPMTHGDYLVVLKSGEKLMLSRRYWERLSTILKGKKPVSRQHMNQ